MGLSYEILEDFRVIRNGREVTISSRIQRRILAVLLIDLGSAVPTERLTDAVWGEDAPTSRQALNFHLSRLRDALEPDRAAGASATIQTIPAGYRLMAEPEDVDLFRWVAGVDEATDRLARDPTGALALITALCEVAVDPMPEFMYDEFTQPTIRAIQRDRARVERLRVDALLALGRNDEAIACLRSLHDADPYDEAVVARLVMSLYRSGHQTEALRTYDRTRELLVDELGIDPGPELEAAHLSVLQQNPQLLAPDRGGPTSGAKHNLPAEPTPLINREEVLASLDDALASSRLVTLTGIRGVGKSRIARAWGRNRRDRFPSGVVYLDVSSLPANADPAEELALAYARALGQAVDPSNVAASLAGLEALVILDGLDDSAELTAIIHDLLSGNECRVLATATDPLRINSPSIVVEGLSETSSIDMIKQSRMPSGPGSAEGDWSEIVRASAGVPAALLYASTATRLGNTAEVPPAVERHVGELVAASIESLSVDLQGALIDLSQFRGPFTVADAEQVADAGSAVEMLGQLMDRGLIRLVERGLELALPVRTTLADQRAPRPTGLLRYARCVDTWQIPRLGEQLLDTEAALRVLARHEPESGVDLLARVAPFLWETGRNSLLLEWHRIATADPRRSATPALERALYYATHAAMAVGGIEEAEECAARHSTACDDLGGDATVYGLLTNADVAWFIGDVDRARSTYEAAAVEATRLNHPDVVTALFGGGAVAANTGDLATAAEAADHVIAAGAAASLPWAGHLGSELLGLVALARGEHEGAVAYLLHARNSSRRVDRLAAGQRLVAAHLAAKNVGGAQAAWEALESEARSAGVPPDPGTSYIGALLFHTTGDDVKRQHLINQGGRSVIASPAAIWIALALAVTSIVHPDIDRRERAQRLAEQHLAATGIRLLPPLAVSADTGGNVAAVDRRIVADVLLPSSSAAD